MNFLRKNYEKIILLGLFVVFILVLLQLINIINQAKETDEDSFAFSIEGEATYVVANPESDEFNVVKVIDKDNKWDAPKVGVKKNHSDFTQAFAITRCGHDNCNSLIPLSVLLNGGNCPKCGKELIKFEPKKILANNSNEKDTDEDGIPDMVEVKYELGPYNPNDARLDLDGDGFSNVFEYLQGTEMNDALSHPPYYLALKVDSIERQVLDMSLKGVEVFGEDRKNWTVQIETGAYKLGKRAVKAKNNFKGIGGSVQLGTETYTIKSIDFKEVDAIVDNKATKKREYTVIVTDKQNREISMVSDQVVYSPDDRINFSSVIDTTAKIYGVVGGFINLGSKVSGFKRYKIVSMNNKRGNLTATLYDPDSKSKEFVVGKTVQIPEEYQAISREDGADFEDPNFEMGEPAPRRRR